jgi:hypothetical protein
MCTSAKLISFYCHASEDGPKGLTHEGHTFQLICSIKFVTKSVMAKISHTQIKQKVYVE